MSELGRLGTVITTTGRIEYVHKHVVTIGQLQIGARFRLCLVFDDPNSDLVRPQEWQCKRSVIPVQLPVFFVQLQLLTGAAVHVLNERRDSLLGIG